MRQRPALFITTLCGLLLLVSLFMWVSIAQAQCGSQASTCKDCHEVQGQDPVNNDGTSWHESHAFGDFCYICHAGNQQATDKDAAHQGMEAPLDNIQASCQSCHPSDLEQRAEVYAKILGVDLENAGSTQALATLAATPISDTAPATEQTAAAAPASDDSSGACPTGNTQIALDDPNLVDYAQQYNQVVLGERPVNWGDAALVGLIGLVLVGGGGFVVVNEVRMRRASGETSTIEGEYPADVIDLLPALTNLKSKSCKSLKRILDNPDKTDQVLGLIDTVVSDDDEEKNP